MKTEISYPKTDETWVSITVTFDSPEDEKPKIGETFKISIKQASYDKYYQADRENHWPEKENSESFFEPANQKFDNNVLTIGISPDIISNCPHKMYHLHIKGQSSSTKVQLIFDPKQGFSHPLKNTASVGSVPQKPITVNNEPSADSNPLEDIPPAKPAQTIPEKKVFPFKKLILRVLSIVAILAVILAMAWVGVKTWPMVLAKFKNLSPPASELSKTEDTPKTDAPFKTDEPDIPFESNDFLKTDESSVPSERENIFKTDQPAETSKTPTPPVALKPKAPLEEARELIRENNNQEAMEQAFNRLDNTPGAEDAVFLLAKVLAGRKPQYRMRYAAFMDPADDRPSGSIKKDPLAAYAEYQTAEKNGVPEAGKAMERLRSWVDSQPYSGDANLARFRKLYGGDRP